MRIMSMILTSIALMSYIILAPAPATATVPLSSTTAGQNRSVYVSLHYEDAGEGMAVIKARLQQDIHALEHVFQTLQETGELDSRYPILLVRAGHHPAAESGFTPAAATLSLTPAVALTGGFPMEGPLDGIYRTENLGRAYVIDTSTGLLSFDNLLAFVLLLPRLNEQNPVLTVSDEETLAQIKNSKKYQAFSKLRLELRPFEIWGTPEGLEGLAPVWQAGVFSYRAYDLAGNRLFELQPLDYYLAKPSLSPPIPRFLAYATENELYFVELFSRKTRRIDLTALFPQSYLQMSESIELAVSPQGDHIYFTLSFNLPEEFWETGNHTYVFAPDTGEIRVAEAKAPEAAEPAPESSPGIPGAVTEFVEPLPGYVSPVHQLGGMGWQPGRISRHEYESFVSPYWAALLPKDSPLVFFPAGLLAQSRFLAYGSQEEIVVFNIIEQEYYRLNLKELHPADYKGISNIRFAQNPTGDKIYFSLEGYAFITAAYVWDIFTNTLEQSGKTLEEMQQEGWAEFAPGAADYLLPPGSKVLAGNEARKAIFSYMLSLPAGALVSLLAWLGVLFFAFGLPFVLAHATTFLAALKLKSVRLLFGPGPALITTLFVALSILAIKFTLPYGEAIKGLVYPLPWVYRLASSAGEIFMWGFVTVVLAVLTILVFYQARVLARTLFQGSAGFHREEKIVAASAYAVYGLAGALLLLLLYFLAAVRLPYLQLPKGLDLLLFPALLFALCLAVSFFLLRASLAAAGYLAAAAAFLGIAVLGYRSVGYMRAVGGYYLWSEAERSLLLESWLSYLASVLPVTLVCIVYLLRIELLRRGRTLKAPAALAAAVLIAVPATAILLYAERLHWFVPDLGYFALPATLVLFVLTAGTIIAALVHVFRSAGRQPLPPEAPSSVVMPTAEDTLAPTTKRLKFPVGQAVAGVSALLVFIFLTLEGAGGAIPRYLGLLLLLSLFYLAVSSVFYLARLLTVRLAGLLFMPGRISELTSKP
ncbi:MAG: hypothetical protein AB1796_14645 [Bacillota bacterium]